MDYQLRRQRIEEVLHFISNHDSDEACFGLLYRKLLEEIDHEIQSNNYKSINR